MPAIDPNCHPLLSVIAQDAAWEGKDDYPAFTDWADRHEKWLGFIDRKGQLARFLPRLRGKPTQRDETLAEIGVAHFLEVESDLLILEWEPLGADGKLGEFLVDVGESVPVFIEVKSPGWEGDLLKQGADLARIERPKWLSTQSSSGFADASAIGDSIRKAYPKMTGVVPSLLVVSDDLHLPLSDLIDEVRGVLYQQKVSTCSSGPFAQDGLFQTPEFNRLGGVATFNLENHCGGAGRPDPHFSTSFAVFANPSAVATATLPTDFVKRFDPARASHCCRRSLFSP